MDWIVPIDPVVPVDPLDPADALDLAIIQIHWIIDSVHFLGTLETLNPPGFNGSIYL